MSNRATQIRQRRALLLWFLWCRLLVAALEDAHSHYWVGVETWRKGLYVDWEHVARCMGEAVEVVFPEEQEVADARPA